MQGTIRMLLVGAPGSEFRRATEMARDAGAEVATADSGAQALELLRERAGDLVMFDVAGDITAFIDALRAERFMVPVIACGIHASAERAVAAIRAGARDYVPLPPERELIAAAIASVAARSSDAPLGNSPALGRAVALAEAVAPSSAPVLIHGEPGSGKETLARLLHDRSGRQPLVIAECAGVAAEVLESELFGHEQGAFAGAAARRAGRLEKAGHGTIVLREVGAMTPALQARLLSVLREQRFSRVGGSDALAFHARLIATTSLDLAELATAGHFRADLLARLGLVRIEVPPLRERCDDIALLAEHLVERFAASDGIPALRFTPEAFEVAANYGWPGNVRELEDTIHRAMLIARGPQITAADLVRSDGEPLAAEPSPAVATPPISDLVGHTVEEVERELILQTLQHCQGNRTTASHILGISVRTMRNKLRSFIEAGIAVSPAA